MRLLLRSATDWFPLFSPQELLVATQPPWTGRAGWLGLHLLHDHHQCHSMKGQHGWVTVAGGEPGALVLVLFTTFSPLPNASPPSIHPAPFTPPTHLLNTALTVIENPVTSLDALFGSQILNLNKTLPLIEVGEDSYNPSPKFNTLGDL